jgi:hypothetical protein
LRGTRASISNAEVSPTVLPSENIFLGDTEDSSSDDDAPIGSYRDSSEDNADQFVCAPRKGKEVRGVNFVGGDNVVLSLTATAFNEDRDVGSEQSLPVAGQSSPSDDSPKRDEDGDTGANIDEVHELADANKGSEVPDASDLAEAAVLRVYKCTGRGKKKLQNARQKEYEIKSIVCKELGLTANMVQSSLHNHKDTHDLKKATPKRYNSAH